MGYVRSMQEFRASLIARGWHLVLLAAGLLAVQLGVERLYTEAARENTLQVTDGAMATLVARVELLGPVGRHAGELYAGGRLVVLPGRRDVLGGS